MIPSESSSPDCHTREDGGHHRVQTTAAGWRLPAGLVNQIKELARAQGLARKQITRGVRSNRGFHSHCPLQISYNKQLTTAKLLQKSLGRNVQLEQVQDRSYLFA